jgi:DNA-binding MarR family transcriptional regulator
MSTAPRLSGIDIGTAANATRKLLDVLLREADVTFEEMVALNTVFFTGPAVERRALVDDLAGRLSLDRSTIESQLARLESRGLIRERTISGEAAPCVELTTDGHARGHLLRAAIKRTTDELYSVFDPVDLATTRTVLHLIAERATARLARTRHVSAP